MKIEPMSVEQIKEVVADWADDVAHGIADDHDPRAVWAMTWAVAYSRWRALYWGKAVDDCQREVLDEINWPKDQR